MTDVDDTPTPDDPETARIRAEARAYAIKSRAEQGLPPTVTMEAFPRSA